MMSKSKIAEEVQAFVGLCLGCLEHLTHTEVAERSGISLSTIYRLAKGGASDCTRIGTIARLGDAAGLRLELTPSRARVKVVA